MKAATGFGVWTNKINLCTTVVRLTFSDPASVFENDLSECRGEDKYEMKSEP